MNGIGIHSMRRIARTKGNWRYWSSREKKEEKKKKRRNERGHNDIPYCDFITAQLILFGSESLRIAFRFRGVKTPAANTPNTLDPFPFPFLSAALPVTLSYLSSPGSIPFRPQLFPSPSPSRKNRKNLKAPLNRVHVFLLLTDFPPPLSSPRLFAPRLFATRVSRFTERVSRDDTPAFRSPLFLLSFSSRSLLLSSWLSRHSRSGQTSHFETNEEEEGFLGYAFSFRFEPLPLLSFLHSFGHVKGKR